MSDSKPLRQADAEERAAYAERSQPERSAVKMEARNPGRGRFFVGVVSTQ